MPFNGYWHWCQLLFWVLASPLLAQFPADCGTAYIQGNREQEVCISEFAAEWWFSPAGTYNESIHGKRSVVHPPHVFAPIVAQGTVLVL